MIELARLFRPLTEAPLLFQPNAGQPVISEVRPTYRQQPAEFAEDLKARPSRGQRRGWLLRHHPGIHPPGTRPIVPRSAVLAVRTQPSST